MLRNSYVDYFVDDDDVANIWTRPLENTATRVRNGKKLYKKRRFYLA